MSVSVVRTYKLETNGGQVLYLSEKEAQSLAVDETRATLTCDSSRCKARHAAESPQTVSWVEEDCQKDPTKIPDAVSDFIAFAQGKVACSPACLKDYITFDHVRPPSPRELRAKMEEEKKAQAEELKDLNPHLRAPEPVQNRTEYHVTELPATLPKHCGDTLKLVAAGDEGDTIARGVATPAVAVPALCQEATGPTTECD
jgi:hypothetical protein